MLAGGWACLKRQDRQQTIQRVLEPFSCFRCQHWPNPVEQPSTLVGLLLHLLHDICRAAGFKASLKAGLTAVSPLLPSRVQQFCGPPPQRLQGTSSDTKVDDSSSVLDVGIDTAVGQQEMLWM